MYWDGVSGLVFIVYNMGIGLEHQVQVLWDDTDSYTDSD